MSDDHMSDNEEELITTLANPEIVDKYKIAATIANGALAHVAQLCQPGVSIVELCEAGDAFIRAEAEKVCQKHKNILKGVGSPTAISIDNIISNFCPLKSDPIITIQEGDTVKIALGAHIDGVVSQMAHTVVATSNPQEPVVGRKADVICAAHFAGECALRLCRPGHKASEITKAIRDVATVFQCNPVEGTASYQVDRYNVQGEKSIRNVVPEDEKDTPEDITFEENEAYCIDIVMSTGEGEVKDGAAKTTIYRKTETMYQLKMKASRFVLNEAATKYKQLPFALRALEDEKRGRLGVVECLKAGLLKDYPVMYEKTGEIVAQFKFTVLLLPNSIQKLNAYNLPYVQSQYNLNEQPELAAILQMGLKRTSNSKKKKKKKKKKAAAATADAMDTE